MQILLQMATARHRPELAWVIYSTVLTLFTQNIEFNVARFQVNGVRIAAIETSDLENRLPNLI